MTASLHDVETSDVILSPTSTTAALQGDGRPRLFNRPNLFESRSTSDALRLEELGTVANALGSSTGFSWSTSMIDDITSTMSDRRLPIQDAAATRFNWPVLLLFSIVGLTLAGNLLVCLAVHRNRKLQNTFNYFLVSLAMSDMLSAVLVMPLSILQAFVGIDSLTCIVF